MAAAAILVLTDANFDAQAKANPRLLVDFWAEWCGPCRTISPIVDEVAAEYKDRLAVAKVNVDENQKLAARFGVRSIPTLLLLRDGARVDQLVGLQSKASIKSKVDHFLSAA